MQTDPEPSLGFGVCVSCLDEQTVRRMLAALLTSSEAVNLRERERKPDLISGKAHLSHVRICK